MDYQFASLLRGFRLRANLKQHELAMQVGCARNTISNWERSEHLPRPGDRALLERIAAILALDAGERARFLGAAVRLGPPGSRLPAPGAAITRDADVDRLVQQLAQERVAVLVGVAGGGKTTLAALVAQRRASAGRLVFWHSCSAVEGLSRLLVRLAELLAEHGQIVARDRLRAGEEGRGQRLSLAEMADLVLDALLGTAIMLCLDDYHQIAAEPLAHEFVQQLIARRSAHQVELLLTSRQLPYAALRPHVEKTSGLSVADTRRLLASFGLQSLPEPLFAQLYRKTHGNPQLLILARERLRRSADLERTIKGLGQLDLINVLLHERYEELAEPERAVMAAVAVLLDAGGGQATITHLLAGASVGRTLYRLCTQLWLERSDDHEAVYTQHELVREFCYGLIAPEERAALHRRAADAFLAPASGDAPDQFRAVLHLVHSGEHQRAAELVAAQLWKVAAGGRMEALAQLLDQRLMGAELPAPLLQRLYLARGELATLLGRLEDARAAYAAARLVPGRHAEAADRTALEARICRGLAETWEHEQPAEALRWVELGLAGLTDRAAPERAYLLIRKGAILSGKADPAAAREALEAGLAILPREDQLARAQALGSLGRLMAIAGAHPEARSYFEQALALFKALGNQWGELGASENIARIDELDLERWEQAAAEYGRLLTVSRESGSINRQITLELSLGIVRTNQGRHGEALAHLQRCEGLVRAYQQLDFLTAALSSLADLHLRMGEALPAWAYLVEATEVALRNPAGELDQLPEIYRGWTQLSLLLQPRRGEHVAQAHEAARAALRYGRRLGRQTGRQEEAGKSLRVLALALAAGGAQRAAERAFAASLHLLERYGRYEAARTRVAWGRALVEQSDHARGLALLEAAMQCFQELGAAADLAAVTPYFETR